MKKFRTAVIGCGGISQVHLTALSKMENVELVSVADVKEDRAKARAEAFHCAWTTDWSEYVRDPSIEVVHLCTPHYLHAPMAMRCWTRASACSRKSPSPARSRTLRR